MSLNQDVREKRVDLLAAGHGSDETDLIITLFRAYGTATNEEFKNAILFWKSEWNSRVFTTADQLMTRADAKYVELKNLGTWGRRSDKDEQIIALTAKIDELTKNPRKDTPNDKDKDKDKSQVPKWKYDRSLSTSTTLNRHKKTYYWCTGPGHQGKGMWTIHKPGTCTQSTAPATKPPDKPSSGLDKTALTAELQSKGLSDDEVTSKIEAILAVMES